MKTYFSLSVLVLLVLFSGCKSDAEDTATTGFTADLMNLSNKHFDLFCTTRSDGTTLNIEAFNEMLNSATNLSEKYDLANIVRASGYYSNTDESVVNLDLYETLRYFEANSTPEYYDLILSMIIAERKINNNDIIINNKLLPNEQIALILVNNMMKSNSLDLETTNSVAGCRTTYNKSMQTCDKIMYLSSALSVAVGIASFGTLATICGVATGIDYARCSGAAQNTYMGCIERYL